MSLACLASHGVGKIAVRGAHLDRLSNTRRPPPCRGAVKRRQYKEVAAPIKGLGLHCTVAPERVARRGIRHGAAIERKAMMSAPIELFYWPTPNGKKITIALHEMGLAYNLNLVNIGKGEQFEAEFLRISPNNRMPAIVDPEGPDGAPISVFESGAILQYLARKTGRFYGANERERVAVEEWLFWQMGGVGPMAGQAHHFLRYAPSMELPQDLPYAKDRYRREVGRLYGVLDRRLEGRDYVAGDFSIADMAIWPWAMGWEAQEQDLGNFPNIAAWLERVGSRPAVIVGNGVAIDQRSDLRADREAQRILFGQKG